jgi:hypothetical protein
MQMIVCPSCGEENPAKFRLCGYCGTPLAQTLPPSELRKTVTILFSDLKGSTALGESVDPEALHEIKNRYFEAMAAVLDQHGGKIEKYIGDAIMAVFWACSSRWPGSTSISSAATGSPSPRGWGSTPAKSSRRPTRTPTNASPTATP